jgi:hypothetical protein
MGHVDIHITAINQGRFEAKDSDGKLLCVSHQPLLDSARVLIGAGFPPETKLVMYTPDGLVSIKAPLGTASELTVIEGDKAPHFRPWKPHPRALHKGQETSAVESPARLSELEAPSLAPDEENASTEPVY